MKTLAVFLMLCMAATCAAQVDVSAAIALTNVDTLTQVVKELSGEVAVTLSAGTVKITSRATSTGKSYAREYLSNKLRSYGLTPVVQIYTGGANVYAVQAGAVAPDAQYILCAHFDAVTNYCADDDASGCAVVLEAARILSKVPVPTTVVYVFFDQEEVGGVGSDAYVSAAKARNDNIVGVVNVEMCAWDSDNDGLIDIHTDTPSLDLTTTVTTVNTTYAIGLHSQTYVNSGAESDYLSFEQQGIKAICYSEAYYGGDFNPYYHSSSDRVSRFNMGYFWKQAKLGVGALAILGNTVPPPLPIQLTSFTGVATTKGIIITWKTISELNSYEFVLQRKSGWQQYKTIVRLPAQGTTNVPHTYTYADTGLAGGTYTYLLKEIDLTGASTNYGPISVRYTKPRTLAIYPNPANPSTRISYRLDVPARVSLIVYDVLGREVTRLVDNESQEVGDFALSLDVRNLASGVYFASLVVDGIRITQRIMVAK